MKKVRVCIELDEATYHKYVVEASSRGVSVESLVEAMVNGLVHEMQQQERDGTDHEIILP